MGTVFSVHINDPGDWSPAVARVVELLHEVDRVFSPYRAESDVSRLARGAIRLPGCRPELADVLALCAEATARTDGYFSAHVDGRLDPTGLVKGWSIQRAADLLAAAGATSYGVNGGGDMQLAGGRGDGRPWRVGIAHPRHPGALATVVSGHDLAVATSGSAERGAHITDPHTGRPARGLAAVTVTGPSIVWADAYATAACAMGRGARTWLTGLGGYEAYVVDDDGHCWATSGFPAAAPASA